MWCYPPAQNTIQLLLRQPGSSTHLLVLCCFAPWHELAMLRAWWEKKQAATINRPCVALNRMQKFQIIAKQTHALHQSFALSKSFLACPSCSCNYNSIALQLLSKWIFPSWAWASATLPKFLQVFHLSLQQLHLLRNEQSKRCNKLCSKSWFKARSVEALFSCKAI